MLRHLLIFTICLAQIGCESFGAKATYVTLADQVYYTRGASEARLGSIGIEDNAGIDSFERQRFDESLIRSLPKFVRAEMSVNLTRNATAKGSAAYAVTPVNFSASATNVQTTSIGLAIVDFDKSAMIEALNQRDDLKAMLRRGAHWRIVTAIAVFTVPYEAVRDDGTKIALSVDEIGKLATGEFELNLQRSETTTISPGSIYAYQTSHIGWCEDLRDIVILKTDRPGVDDHFYMPDVINADGNRTAEPFWGAGK